MKELTLALPSALHAKLKAKAESVGISVKSIIVFALWNRLGKNFLRYIQSP